MHQIWTNPSLERSFIQSDPIAIKNIEHFVVNIAGSTVHIVSGFEYAVEYYDTETGLYKSVYGLVQNVWGDQIKMRVNPDSLKVDCCKCTLNCSMRQNGNKATTSGPMPICKCILNPPDMSKYDDPIDVFIPFANMAKITYITNKNALKPDNKEGARVMLLGISATTLKAIIIHLEFFDDNFEKAVKYVDLEAGGIYNIAYADRDSDNTVYEFIGKLHSIEEIKDTHCTGNPGFVRENVGGANNVYVNQCCNKKSDFMQAPPVKRVKLTFDTSENFTGRYESYWLDSIRDCTLIKAADSSTTPDDGGSNDDPICKCCCHKTDGCTPGNCGHHNNAEFSHDYTFNDGKTTATVDKDGNISMSTINSEGSTIEEKTTIEDMIKFYLGID